MAIWIFVDFDENKQTIERWRCVFWGQFATQINCTFARVFTSLSNSTFTKMEHGKLKNFTPTFSLIVEFAYKINVIAVHETGQRRQRGGRWTRKQISSKRYIRIFRILSLALTHFTDYVGLSNAILQCSCRKSTSHIGKRNFNLQFNHWLK